MESLVTQLLWLVILAIPVASVAWTITHEEIFREPRDFCKIGAKPLQGSGNDNSSTCSLASIALATMWPPSSCT